MKVLIKNRFTMRGGKSSIIGETPDLPYDYALFLINNGHAERIEDAKASDKADTASKRTGKP
jgi:hypothetical protein